MANMSAHKYLVTFSQSFNCVIMTPEFSETPGVRLYIAEYYVAAVVEEAKCLGYLYG